jgi:release factor glutamine methyltransferase
LPELVEGLSFFLWRKKERPFDKLREAGCCVWRPAGLMKIRQALLDAERRLAAIPGQPRQDAELLMANALGTGIGAMHLRLDEEAPAPFGALVERRLAREPIAYARRNAQALRLADRADFRQGDWADGLDAPFDLVLCNPPYVEANATLDPDVRDWEPYAALFAGEDGLAAYRRLAPHMPRLVRPGGLACIEHGQGQEHAVAALFAAPEFTISSRADLRGIPRCLVLRA